MVCWVGLVVCLAVSPGGGLLVWEDGFILGGVCSSCSEVGVFIKIFLVDESP